MTPQTKRLIEWISKHAWCESRFLTPRPVEHVPMIPLLDEIAVVFGIPHEEIAEIVNAPQDENGEEEP